MLQLILTLKLIVSFNYLQAFLVTEPMCFSSSLPLMLSVLDPTHILYLHLKIEQVLPNVSKAKYDDLQIIRKIPVNCQNVEFFVTSVERLYSDE